MIKIRHRLESIAATVSLLAAATGYKMAPRSARLIAQEEVSQVEIEALRDAYLAIESVDVRQALLDVVTAVVANAVHNNGKGMPRA